MTISTSELVPAIRDAALALGFDAIRLTRADLPAETGAHYRRFIGEGRHGSMAWLAREPERRAHPRALWAEARSVLVCAQNYGPATDPRATLEQPEAGTISVYARNRDYHDLVKGRLKQLAQWLHHRSKAEVKVFVDTAPVLEKPLAQQAGLGWQGKHTNLVSRGFGSWLLLGEIFTTLDLSPDPPEEDHCGQCRRCLDICPTAAFTGPYRLDARRCISYLTIEHAGPIPHELRPLMGNRIYGCDDCLAVCPWNKFAAVTREAKLQARADLEAPSLAALAALDDPGFRTLFSGSPIKRIGRDRFLRNVLVAIGNSRRPALLPAVTALLADASPLVRGAAVWALGRLAPTIDTALPAGETDPMVVEEWRLLRDGRRAA